MKRIASIDFVRGLVMIIMTLDHTRDLMHTGSLTQSPTDLATTTPILFFTRWITHLCAPGFVFLAGVSAFLSSQKHSLITAAHSQPGITPGHPSITPYQPGITPGHPPINPSQPGIRPFLLRRGLWLILLEFTIVNFALWTDLRFRTLLFEVIGAIGAGFIILSLICKLAPKTIGIIALVIIFGHDVLSGFMPKEPILKFAGAMLMGPSAFPFGSGRIFIVAYGILPWLGIMLAGFACGRIFLLPAVARKAWLSRTGIAALILFLLLRAANIYGDPSPWSVQKNGLFTFLSFMNTSKYPPSLLFTLLTLGIIFLIFYTSEERNGIFTRIVSVYGKTPLFYFIVHLYIIHLVMFAMVFLQGFHAKDLVFGALKFGRPEKGSGLPLQYIYGTWLVVVASLYPLCRWYGRYKTANPEKSWLRYV